MFHDVDCYKLNRQIVSYLSAFILPLHYIYKLTAYDNNNYGTAV